MDHNRYPGTYFKTHSYGHYNTYLHTHDNAKPHENYNINPHTQYITSRTYITTAHNMY